MRDIPFQPVDLNQQNFHRNSNFNARRRLQDNTNTAKHVILPSASPQSLVHLDFIPCSLSHRPELSIPEESYSEFSSRSALSAPFSPSSANSMVHGSYGKVLLGQFRDSAYGGLCVIKKSQLSSLDDQHELTTLKWIAHCKRRGHSGSQFLQSLWSSFEDGPNVFIVLEYHPFSLADRTIASRLRLARACSTLLSPSLPLNSPTSVQAAQKSLRLVAGELVLGLLFLHDHGIIVKNIKPHNILISAAGHVIIAGFGDSTVGPEQGRTISSLDPCYAAPELFHRTTDNLIVYDRRVDWWSLGILLYKLATGSLPYHSDLDETPGPRSSADLSVTFEHLEQIAFALGHARDLWDHQLEWLLRSLLVLQADQRLSGFNVKCHPFFDPISTIWVEISALGHPPLPNPCPMRLNASTDAPNISFMSEPLPCRSSSTDLRLFEPRSLQYSCYPSLDSEIFRIFSRPQSMESLLERPHTPCHESNSLWPHRQDPSLSASFSSQIGRPWTLAESLTLSVLEAMDSRDFDNGGSQQVGQLERDVNPGIWKKIRRRL
ncbi:kinase-like domain-containing protein [Mycena floridula]|nr:kinase-like domain-containing protein [Mycena floridula]